MSFLVKTDFALVLSVVVVKTANWYKAAISGAVTTLFVTLAGDTLTFLTTCSSTITDSVRLTWDSSDIDNSKGFLIAGSVLTLATFALATITVYGAERDGSLVYVYHSW